jgi:hypothetical protein
MHWSCLPIRIGPTQQTMKDFMSEFPYSLNMLAIWEFENQHKIDSCISTIKTTSIDRAISFSFLNIYCNNFIAN